MATTDRKHERGWEEAENMAKINYITKNGNKTKAITNCTRQDVNVVGAAWNCGLKINFVGNNVAIPKQKATVRHTQASRHSTHNTHTGVTATQQPIALPVFLFDFMLSAYCLGRVWSDGDGDCVNVS